MTPTGEVMEACIARAPDRFRGIRQMAAWDASPIVNTLRRPPQKDLLMDPSFREGFAKLAPLGLSFDLWCYHPQLDQALDLVDTFPDTRIIINHMGGRVGIGPVGSGSAGGVVASRLSESGRYSVLCLEAGNNRRNPRAVRGCR